MRRVVVGSLASVFWPALVVLIPMGITFAAARVYAEGAPSILSCDAGPVVACADAGDLPLLCSPGRYASLPGICLGGGCNEGSETHGNASVCHDVQFCKDVVTVQCRSKPEGTSCTTGAGQGECRFRNTGGYAPDICYEVDGGAGVKSSILDCVVDAAAPLDAGGTDDCFGNCYRPTPDADAPLTTSSSSGDSGCSTSSSGTSLPLLGGPLALGILLALRRQRKRSK